MAKLVLGQAPKSFKRKISIDMLDGGKADFEVVFKYKTRNEYAKLIDKVVDVEESDEKLKSSEIYKIIDEKACDLILEIVESWDLTDAFSKKSVQQLISEFPQASNKIIEEYRLATLEGRVKKLEALATAMYEKAVDESELNKFGLTVEDFSNDAVVIWQENQMSYFVFSAMSTQWRIGMNGATGLDYNVLGEIWRRLKIPFHERDQVFIDLQVMEHAALKQMNKAKAD